MNWESLNERLEEAYRTGAEDFYRDKKIYDNFDSEIVGKYIKFITENYPSKDKPGVEFI